MFLEATMRCVSSLLVISLLVTGCHQRDTELRQGMFGTWIPNSETNCTIILARNGTFTTKFMAVRTNVTKELIYEGTWRVTDGFHTLTITNASGYEPHQPVGTVERYKIVRLDKNELVCQNAGDTNHLVYRRK
jgi:hypothetical protein